METLCFKPQKDRRREREREVKEGDKASRSRS
jgi:hypothetical protein